MIKKIKSKLAFTLVEIMIVVGIIMILVIIAVPGMIRAKMTGNENNALAAVRAISTSCNLYFFQSNTFPPNLAALATAVPPYIGTDLANAINAANAKDGYYYVYALVGTSGFTITARPSRWNTTGSRCFSVDQDVKLLYCNTAQNCTPNLPMQ